MNGRLLRAWFVASVAVLGVGYGVVAGQQGWFPGPQLRQAWAQARALTTDNPFSYLVPRVYDRHGARTLRPEAVQPGVTLISSMATKASSLAVIHAVSRSPPSTTDG